VKTKAGAPSSLTIREREVFELIAQGVSTRHISSSLNIEIATVRKHRENLMRKLDLHSTSDIVLFALGRKKPGKAATRTLDARKPEPLRRQG
jgi:DNA-binding NarL/FixJ family response regulator